MKVGFIGLGNMGMGMSANLLKAGFPLAVHDVRKERADTIL
jgi:3-hydroxyisobutyrate dehydrogenase